MVNTEDRVPDPGSTPEPPGTAAAPLAACADCGLLQTLPPPVPGTVIECSRCQHVFIDPARCSIDMALGSSVAALLLLLPAMLMPLMTLSSLGASRISFIPTGVKALWDDGFFSLAGIMCLFSVVIPFVYLAIMIWVLWNVRGMAAGPRPASAPAGTLPLPNRLFRFALALRPWVMVEVYVVGGCVAYTRLEAIGTVTVGTGGWCLVGAGLALVFGTAKVDEQVVWDALPVDGRADVDRVSSSDEEPISCNTCQLLFDAGHEHQPCPRCGTRLRRRKFDTRARTLALVLCGYLLYLPANVLPVLSIDRFGSSDTSTIIGGVRELITNGLWPLAAIVFTASIVVPMLKLLGLSGMLLLTHRRSPRWLLGRTRLYRFIDFIGRWSNIDLFMISILVALVQFGTLSSVRAQPGAIAFAAVVIITMLASHSFDSRVMWDAGGRSHAT